MADKRIYDFSAATPADTDLIGFDAPAAGTYAEMKKAAVSAWRAIFHAGQATFTISITGSGYIVTTTFARYYGSAGKFLSMVAKCSLAHGGVTSYIDVVTSLVGTGQVGQQFNAVINPGSATEKICSAIVTAVTPATIRIYTGDLATGTTEIHFNGTLIS